VAVGAIRAAGGLLVLAGLLLAARSALLLAGRGRPRRGERPALVIAGPYRRTRNPLLLGFVTATLGLAWCTGSVRLMGVALFGALASHLWVICFEEGRLRERFGPTYDTYQRHVPRWLPRLGKPS
jgi:protein-S-isoprenylcysteine O-methyltransferase Ste14